MNFEPNHHLHIGYYDKGFDLEATAYKTVGHSEWVIFLNSDQDLTDLNDALYCYKEIDKLGYKIFTVNTDDLSYEYGLEKFTEWLKSLNLI